jgi:hypothetical protein
MAAWVNALYFLGMGAKAAQGGANPLKTVGWISLVSGLGAFVVVWYLLVNRPAPLGDNSVAVAGLASIYVLFFVALGAVEIGGLDLKPIANLSIAIAVASLPFIPFFAGSILLQSIMVVWTVAFALVATTVYGRTPAQWLGLWLVVTAIWTFWLPAVMISLGIPLF